MPDFGTTPGIYEDSNIHLSLPPGWSVIGGVPGDILLLSDGFEESGVSDAGAAPIGTFSGTQTQTGRLFAGRLKSKNRQTVILYLESYVGTRQETAALADEILSGLHIK